MKQSFTVLGDGTFRPNADTLVIKINGVSVTINAEQVGDMIAFMQEVIRVRQERCRQIDKWGVQHYDDGKWMWVIMEEIGEVAKELNEQPDCAVGKDRLAYLERLRCEITQVATVAIAWNERTTERIEAIVP